MFCTGARGKDLLLTLTSHPAELNKQRRVYQYAIH